MKKVRLKFTEEALSILAMTPPIREIKTAPHNQRRLMRIRANLFRELKALNKELQRHKPEIKIRFT